LCEQLASEGFNIVMIARNREKLEAAKKAVMNKNSLCDILIISKDFTESSEAGFFTEIEQKIEGLDVSILVNNVGVMPPADNLAYTTPMIRDTVVVKTES
jgi:17beta-estradiol 17-dehydrogenase / very-long-chain 3-oxoacyl-CoA reductase